MPAPIATASLPDRAARATWAAHYASPDGYRYMPAEELVRFCGRRPGRLGRVLEVGCGNGANLWFLARQSDIAVGVDFCESALASARELCGEFGCGDEDLHLSRPGKRYWNSPAVTALADARAMPFTAGSFDIVVDSMMSQHLSWVDHVAVFREYRRVLRPGGTAFVYHLVSGTTGSRPGMVDYPSGIGLFPDAGFVCLPDVSPLVQLLVSAGFRRTEVRGLTRTYPDGAHACYAVVEGTTYDD